MRFRNTGCTLDDCSVLHYGDIEPIEISHDFTHLDCSIQA